MIGKIQNKKRCGKQCSAPLHLQSVGVGPNLVAQPKYDGQAKFYLDRLAPLASGLELGILHHFQCLFIASGADATNHTRILDIALFINYKLEDNPTFNSRFLGHFGVGNLLLQCADTTFQFRLIFYNYKDLLLFFLF